MLRRVCAARKKQPAVRLAANPPQNEAQIRIQKCKIIFTGNAGEYLLHDSIFRRFGVKSDSKPATKYDTKMQKRKGLCFRKAPDLVRQTGLEPVRQRHTPLKRACLPIPALPHLKCEIYYNNNSLQSQGLFGFFITKFCLFLCRRGKTLFKSSGKEKKSLAKTNYQLFLRIFVRPWRGVPASGLS